MPDPTVQINSVNKLYLNAFSQKQSIGVHGNSAQLEVVQSPEDLGPFPQVEIIHRGWGTEVYGNQGAIVWAHFSIPVPLLVNDLPSIVSSVFFYFEVKPRALLRSVHMYDADIKFGDFNSINRDGDFTRNLENHVNTFDVSRTLRYGLGLSLGFVLPRLTSSGEGGQRPTEAAITIMAVCAKYV